MYISRRMLWRLGSTVISSRCHTDFGAWSISNRRRRSSCCTPTTACAWRRWITYPTPSSTSCGQYTTRASSPSIANAAAAGPGLPLRSLLLLQFRGLDGNMMLELLESIILRRKGSMLAESYVSVHRLRAVCTRQPIDGTKSGRPYIHTCMQYRYEDNNNLMHSRYEYYTRL